MKFMKKFFSIINILIIIGIIALSYLSYNKYLEKNIEEILKQEIDRTEKNINNKVMEPEQDGKIMSETVTPSKNLSPTKPTPSETQFLSQPAKPAKPTTKNGFYQNDTYNYQITCPPDWPLRVRNEANVSIGIVPPKNGQGAITIEVISNSVNSVEEAKIEAEKYPGLIKVSETPIELAGVNGYKVMIDNSVTKTKRVYILLEKYGFQYALEYSEESANFVNQAQAALKTFKFTK
jgi:hypothetical protein